jgi:hypothetical protein
MPRHRSRRHGRRRADVRDWLASVRRGWIVHTGWGRSKGFSGGRRLFVDETWRLAAAFAVVVGIVGLGMAGVVRTGLRSARADVDAPARTLPVLPVIPLEFEGVTLETYLGAWVPLYERDELLRSPVLRDPAFARRVHWWMRYWTGPAAGWFPDFLTRMAWLGTTVDSALTEHDLPPSLRYLPLIESGYAPSVTSRAAAVGLWQLMTPTAKALGLEVGPVVDERRHVDRSTDAALSYLTALHDDFDSWFIALAAYNTGPTRVRAILREHAPGEPRSDSLFWALRDHFPPETRDFMPKFFGAMWIASRPAGYGFERPPVRPFTYDTVSVRDRTALKVVARAAGVPYDQVLDLNPHFVRGVTPEGREVTLRVPFGSRETFAARFPLMPTEARADTPP